MISGEIVAMGQKVLLNQANRVRSARVPTKNKADLAINLMINKTNLATARRSSFSTADKIDFSLVFALFFRAKPVLAGFERWREETLPANLPVALSALI